MDMKDEGNESQHHSVQG